MKTFIQFIIWVMFVVLFLHLGLGFHERRECKYWQENPSEVRAEWQRDQCEFHEIPLN